MLARELGCEHLYKLFPADVTNMIVGYTMMPSLEECCEKGYVACIQRILRETGGANDALIYSSERGYAAAVRVLLAAGADLHAWNDEALCILYLFFCFRKLNYLY